MKYLILGMLILSTNLYAHIGDLFKDTTPEKDGKSYLVFVEDEEYQTGEWVLLFGTKIKN